MPAVIAGLFRSTEHAGAAVQSLLKAGIARDWIEVLSGEREDGGHAVAAEIAELGVPTADSIGFANALRAGFTLVLASSESDEIAERAAEIMDEHGALELSDIPARPHVELQRENIHVERRPAERPAPAQHAFEEAHYEFIETEERLVVAKKPRVVEDVVLTRSSERRTATVDHS